MLFSIWTNRFKKYYSLLPKTHHAILLHSFYRSLCYNMILASLLQPNWKLCVRKIRILLFSDYIYICTYTSLYRYICTVSLKTTTHHNKKMFFPDFFCISALNVQKYATELMSLVYFTCYNNKMLVQSFVVC